MKKLLIIGAALALAIPATAYAAAACCMDGAGCCNNKQAGKSCCDDETHGSHDMQAAPAK